MALKKALETQYGVNAEYWAISQTNVNWRERSIHVVVLGWPSREAAQQGHTPLDAKTRDWAGAQFPFVGLGDSRPFNEAVAMVYLALKMEPGSDFAGAEDILEDGQAPIPVPDPIPVDPPPPDPEPEDPPVEDPPAEEP